MKSITASLALEPSPDEYAQVWRIVHSKCSKSLSFGNASPSEIAFVKVRSASSNQDPNGLHFKNTDGSVAPLPRFYRRYVSADDALSSVAARGGSLYPRSFICGYRSVPLPRDDPFSKVASRDISTLTTDL